MIEAKAQEEDPFQVLAEEEKAQGKLFTSEIEEFGNLIEDIHTIMTDYFDYWSGDTLRFIPVKDETGELRYAEHEFAIPLDELVPKSRKAEVRGILFKGQVDGIGKTANKMRWLIENKSFAKMPGDDERWRNFQSIGYVKAVEALGWMKSVDGTCWNYIKSHPPSIPVLLKDGSRLSIKEITTLPSVVLRVLQKHGLSPEANQVLLDRAEASRNEYFQRIYTPLNPSVIENIFNGFIDTAVEMREYHASRRDKNIGRHCGWCDYEPLCRAELTGGDVDWIKDKEYTKEDPEAYRRIKRSAKLKVVRHG